MQLTMESKRVPKSYVFVACLVLKGVTMITQMMEG